MSDIPAWAFEKAKEQFDIHQKTGETCPSGDRWIYKYAAENPEQWIYNRARLIAGIQNGRGVIARERIEEILEDSLDEGRRTDFIPVQDEEMAEICRLCLAVLDAPETEISESHLCDLDLLSDEAMALRGKRVRLVEVK